jgi:hypothetical protein
MGFFDALKRFLGGDDSVEVKIDENKAEIEGLNFQSAIDAHIKWKLRLADTIAGRSQEKLEVATVCRDDQCVLGKWIHGNGKAKYGKSATFNELRETHAHFHKCAGQVLGEAQKGNREQAEKLLTSGEYVKASEKVKRLLVRLYVQLDTAIKPA